MNIIKRPALHRLVPPLAMLLLMGGCDGQHGPSKDGTVNSSGITNAFDDIAPDETVYFTGTEPFWGGQATSSSARWTTPEQSDGTIFPITRFFGNSGLAISGTLDGQKFDMTVTRGECSDGMSDQTYPFTATVMLADRQYQGCAWSDDRPATHAPVAKMDDAKETR